MENFFKNQSVYSRNPSPLLWKFVLKKLQTSTKNRQVSKAKASCYKTVLFQSRLDSLTLLMRIEISKPFDSSITL